MLYGQLVDQKAAPSTILNYGAKSPLTKDFVQWGLATMLEGAGLAFHIQKF